MSTLMTFEDLDAYKKAREFRKEAANFCRTLPKEEAYRLKDQMLRASRSVTANIAEGFGRHHHQENLQFCRQSRGSLSEMLDHLNCALDEAFMDDATYQSLRNLLEESWRVLNGYIGYIQRCANSGMSLVREDDGSGYALYDGPASLPNEQLTTDN